MLNPKTQERELCYVVEINDIQPIPNYDRVELATVNGWHIIVQKNQFKVGDKAIYFEVDSKVPESAAFDFLAKRKYKIKTLKMCGCISQGLLMSLLHLIIFICGRSFSIIITSFIVCNI